MPTAEPERTGDERPDLIRLMRALADEMEEACIRDGVLPPPPPPKSEAERRARRRWGMWPAVLLVGAGLTRLARDHPAAAAVAGRDARARVRRVRRGAQSAAARARLRAGAVPAPRGRP